jgi:trimethylamine--corrinoid protein Co-methyltransferase
VVDIRSLLNIMSLNKNLNPILIQRTAIFSIDQLERIKESAIRILEEIGIAVLDDDIRQIIESAGFKAKDKRIFVQRKLFQEFIKTNQPHAPQPVKIDNSKLDHSVLTYPQHVHDIETDKILPFTTERLIEATKLLDTLSSRGVIWSPPGCPIDVPPPIQPVVQYWVGALYSRHGRHPVDPKSMESMPYIMEMGEVMGHPIRHLPVYVFSPLKLVGESLRCVLKFRDKLSGVGVSDMTSVGCTVPINIGDAFAVALAEVVGSAILVREIVKLPVSWSVRLCPIDMHSMAMVLGSPEDFLLQLACSELNAYFHGTNWYPALSGAHTNAKLPGVQACVEKASLITAGALLGARHFVCAGTLSLDEVFSPEQLLYDIEIKDHIQRMVSGIDVDCDTERCLNDVRESLDYGNFMGLNSTAEKYRDVYWFPKLFERQFLAAWIGEGAITIRKKAHDMIHELMKRHDYELEPELRKELDKILARAKSELL